MSRPAHLAGIGPVHLSIAICAALLLTPVQAQHQGHGGGGAHGGYGRHGGHGGPGGPQSGPAWHGGHGWRAGPGPRGGHWHHGVYGGRNGWWWVTGPSWDSYPDPYWPPPGYLLYCPSFAAYYPYVNVCPGGWALVAGGP